jgi:putative serine protease PepD
VGARLGLRLVEGELCLKAKADRVLLAERLAGDTAGERAEENGEVADPRGDEAVVQQPRDGAEHGAADRPCERREDDGRRGPPQEVAGVRLEDVRALSHPPGSSAWQAPHLRGIGTLTPFLSAMGTVVSPSTDSRSNHHVNKDTILRRVAPVGAALALGAGAGAAVYAGTTGGGGSAAETTTTVVASVPAQQTASTSTTLTQLYKKAAPGVVDITVGQGQGQAEGSGFVYDKSGDIITNAHVVEGATSIKVRFQTGKTATATLVGTDDSTDIAVIKVDVPAAQLTPLPLGSSAGVQVGEEVAAIGSPFGLPGTLTSGIVSAVNRTITAPNNYSISGAIQTDAAINHGNSGGPLLNAAGNVIGVNAQIESDSGGNDGVGFAIPIDATKNVANTLISGGKVQHAYLGIRVGDSSSGDGAQVTSVVSGSPADKGGVKAGDVITSIDGTSISSADDLTARISGKKPGDKVTLDVTRGGKSTKLTVTLGTRPS